MVESRVGIFIPAYCLVKNRLRLTEMSIEAVEIAAMRARHTNAQVIIAAAYGTWKEEAYWKIEMLVLRGINRERISVVPEVTDGYDETKKVGQIIKEFSLTEIIVIAEKYYEKRAVDTFQKYFPGILIRSHRFSCSKFEFTYEPSMIKSFRAGYKWTWALWAWIFELRIVTWLVMKLKR